MQWQDFARPSVAVDVAVLTVVPAATPWLGVLVHRRAGDAYHGRWDIPGGFVLAGETLAVAVLRVLREKSDVRGLQPTQLHVFDDPHRDERGWVMSVAHMDAVPYARLQAAMTARDDVRIVPVEEVEGRIRVKLPGRHRTLPWDHDEIVAMAVERLRERYAQRPDPDGLVLPAASRRSDSGADLPGDAEAARPGAPNEPNDFSEPSDVYVDPLTTAFVLKVQDWPVVEPSATPVFADDGGVPLVRPASAALMGPPDELALLAPPEDADGPTVDEHDPTLDAPAFTLTELRGVHEAVAGHRLQRDTFRRSVEPYLRRTGRTSEGHVGRPGVLYTHEDD